MKYTKHIYQGFEELLHSDGQSASLLLQQLRLPAFDSTREVEDDSRYDWIVQALVVYDSVIDYAYDALTVGEYADQGTRTGSYSALQLKDYVDLRRFGVDLLPQDNPYDYITQLPNGKIIVIM